jgi:hypothetical protein
MILFLFVISFVPALFFLKQRTFHLTGTQSLPSGCPDTWGELWAALGDFEEA